MLSGAVLAKTLSAHLYNNTMLVMNEAIRVMKRILIAAYLLFLHLIVLYFVGERIATNYVAAPPLNAEAIPDPTKVEEVPTTLPVPSIFYNSNTEEANVNRTPDVPIPAFGGELIIPVAGVKPEQLIDSFSDSRSEGRIHDAIDIPSPLGTPVLASADGEIVKFFDSELGGITIYQISTDRKFIFYYAHLQKRADDVKVGDMVKRGRTIGFVGDTGNAGAGNYHLHFSIAIVTDPKRYWEGTSINPYPILRAGKPLSTF